MAATSLRLPSWSAPLPASSSYVLEADQGRTLAIVGSGSIVRYLTSDKETGDDAFAVVQSRGRADEVVPAHLHRQTHDIFLVTQGSLKLYVGDQVRVLHAGDFGSAPPMTPHAYQILSPDTEFVGIIAPGSWIKFFDYISEEFDASPLFPALDGRDFPVPLFIEGVKAGSDVIPLRDYDYSAAKEEPATSENVLPSAVAPYYLRASSGPSWILGNQSLSPLITDKQSHEGSFSLLLLAGIGSSFPSYSAASTPFSSSPVSLPSSFLARAVEGKVTFSLEGANPETITAKESIFVAAGVKFTFKIESAYARFYIFAGKGEGLEKVFYDVGRKVEGGDRHEVVGEKVEAVDQAALAKAVESLQRA